jgi:hypothetical protein
MNTKIENVLYVVGWTIAIFMFLYMIFMIIYYYDDACTLFRMVFG